MESFMAAYNRLALATAVSLVSVGGFAETQLLDETELQKVTGQAGITIDVETQWEIGEFAYQDSGYLLIQGLRMGGNSVGSGAGTGGELLDNLRLDIDIAGDGSVANDNVLNYGFSAMREIAQEYVDQGNLDANYASVASGVDLTRGGGEDIDDKKLYSDGDLVIHFDFTDGWANEGGFIAYREANRFVTDDYTTAEAVLEHAVDFRLEIDAIGVASSDYEVGSAGLDIDSAGPSEGAVGTTTLISQLSVQGYLGPEDLHIENNGNGFDGSGPLGVGSGKADSKIYWSAYTKITDLDMYIDIAGVQITDMQIHNERGDRTGLDGTSSFDFAHSIREIYAVKDSVLNLKSGVTTLAENYVDGIAINTRFKGDIDIEEISFGDTGESIGSFYMTDIASTTNWIISAH
jgi:hypothetical protein